MVIQTKQHEGLAIIAELFAQVARLHDKGVMSFLERAEYVRPSQMLETLTALAGSQLSTILGDAMKWRLVNKLGHLYSLDKQAVIALNTHITVIGFDRYESDYATWNKAARGMSPLASVHGWLALRVLSESKCQIRVNEVTEGVNAIVRTEKIKRTHLGREELALIQQPAMTKLLGALVNLRLVDVEYQANCSYHFLTDRKRLSVIADLGAQYAYFEKYEKPVKKKTSEEILIY